MSRALIAGCGYLGQAVAELLVKRGWQVEGWTQSKRAAEALSQKAYRVSAVDISEQRQLEAVEGKFDAVLHAASTRGGDAEQYHKVYLEGMRNLSHCFPESAILFTSSTSVYAQRDGAWVTEKSPANPEHETGRILIEAERIALDRNHTVARLAGIYGPGRSHLLKKILTGEAFVDPENDRFVNQVHRDDAASAIVLLIESREARGGVFNVVDDQPILQSQCYRWLAARLKREMVFGETNPNRKRGFSNKRVSNAKLRDLGWVPRYPTFFDAMEKSVLPSFL